MADAVCSYHYESAEERVREVKDKSTFENIEGRQPTAPEPQPSTAKDKPRSLFFVSVIAASLFVIFGLAIAGIILVSQERLRLDQAKRMYDNAAAELNGQGRKVNDSLLGKLELEVEELRAQNRKLNNSLLGKMESEVKKLRAQDRKLVKELELEVKELSFQNRNLNDSLLEKLESEVKELRKQNLKLKENFQEKLKSEVNESFRVLHGKFEKHASQQNQTVRDIQSKMQINEMKQNKTRMDLLKDVESCAELRDKYGILESGIYRMKQNGSYYPVYSYCNFQLRTGNDTCGDLLKELGVEFVPGYYWVRDSKSAQPRFKLCSRRPSSCKELVQAESTASGIASVYPTPGIGVSKKVYCDSNGWTVFQRRKDGSVDFYRGWDDYVNGFGDMNGEFWLGLETIYQLTKDGDYELRVDLGDFYGNKAYAEYGRFSISSGSDKYRLNVSSYSGNAGNSLNHENGQQFSTRDNDNHKYRVNCAVLYTGAWWYNSCHSSHLNGKYHSSVGTGYEGVMWWHWKEKQYLKFAEMKFREKN